MKPFLPALIITILFLVLRHNVNKDRSAPNTSREAILERESRANNTRKQDISNLDYIRIPIEQLPFDICKSPDAMSAEKNIRDLCSRDILNLTGISNTELKLEYGPANLDKLTQCDDNFTRLVRALQQWGQCLYNENMMPEATIVLQYSVDIGSDIRNTYHLLATIYANDQQLLMKLREQANNLRSLSKDSILANIETYF